MREHGLLFTDEMVRALRDGRKTQTRRPIAKLRPDAPATQNIFIETSTGRRYPMAAVDRGDEVEIHTSRVIPGDRIWARETWRPAVAHSHGDNACDCGDVVVTYAADGAERFFPDEQIPPDWAMPKAAARGWVPSIHMPRWAARLVFEVERVHLERVQAITEDDARAEGVELDGDGRFFNPRRHRPNTTQHVHNARQAFRLLWDDVYRERGLGWDANPWCFVYDLRRVDGAGGEAAR